MSARAARPAFHSWRSCRVRLSRGGERRGPSSGSNGRSTRYPSRSIERGISDQSLTRSRITSSALRRFHLAIAEILRRPLIVMPIPRSPAAALRARGETNNTVCLTRVFAQDIDNEYGHCSITRDLRTRRWRAHRLLFVAHTLHAASARFLKSLCVELPGRERWDPELDHV